MRAKDCARAPGGTNSGGGGSVKPSPGRGRCGGGDDKWVPLVSDSGRGGGESGLAVLLGQLGRKVGHALGRGCG
jgi:hypothetical protein